MFEFHVWTQEGDFLGGIEVKNGFAELWDMGGAVNTHVGVSGLYEEQLWSVLLNAYACELGVDDSELYLSDIGDSEILWAP